MATQQTVRCEWENCTCDAVKRVTFGHIVINFRQVDNIGVSWDDGMYNLTLCQNHIAEVKTLYNDVQENALTEDH